MDVSEAFVADNAGALERTLDTMRDLGRLAPIDEALLELCRSAARAVDDSPRAGLVKEYRECLVLLAGVGMDDDSDAFEELRAAINAGAEVGDSAEAGT